MTLSGSIALERAIGSQECPCGLPHTPSPSAWWLICVGQRTYKAPRWQHSGAMSNHDAYSRSLARFALTLAVLVPVTASSQEVLLVNIAPPPLPVYAQPMAPGDGYIWTPGYWGWNTASDDYYWVPGTWVLAPANGQLWTPGYWAYAGDGYFWNPGYWGMRVGYYCGLNYGYGYAGNGYQGGRWEGAHFRYNAAASHVDPAVTHNSYNTRVLNYAMAPHASYSVTQSGGTSKHVGDPRQVTGAVHGAPTTEQLQHERAALLAPAQRAWVAHGPPRVAATVRPSAFTAPGVEHVRPEPAVRAPSAPRERAGAHAEQAHGKPPSDLPRPQR